jgi:hypothetical protein
MNAYREVEDKYGWLRDRGKTPGERQKKTLEVLDTILVSPGLNPRIKEGAEMMKDFVEKTFHYSRGQTKNLAFGIPYLNSEELTEALWRLGEHSLRGENAESACWAALSPLYSVLEERSRMAHAITPPASLSHQEKLELDSAHRLVEKALDEEGRALTIQSLDH